MLPEIFRYQNHQIRTIIRDGEPWFVAKDICEVLEIGNSRMAVDRLNPTMKGVSIIDTPGGKQEMSIINEAGIYKLVFRSRKPEAERFTDWLAEEVIPAIRKHGAYITPAKIEEILLNPDTVIQLATALKQEREEKQRLLPKAEAFDTFMDGSNYQKMNVVAKALGVGRNKLFDFLRTRKVLMSDNTPYQEYIDRGYFVVKEKPITMGEQTINKPQTFVTAKGVEYIRRLLKQIA